MAREAEISVFVISTRWLAFFAQLGLTLLHQSLIHFRGAYSRGLIRSFTVYIVQRRYSPLGSVALSAFSR